jgi:hypothetical protein
VQLGAELAAVMVPPSHSCVTLPVEGAPGHDADVPRRLGLDFLLARLVSGEHEPPDAHAGEDDLDGWLVPELARVLEVSHSASSFTHTR